MEHFDTLSVARPHSAPFDRCEDEPIATPGAIQPHGALVVVDRDTQRVSHVSANVEEILGVAPRAFLAMSPGAMAEALHVDPAWLAWDDAKVGLDPAPLPLVTTLQERRCTAQRVLHGARAFFEFEPGPVDAIETSVVLAHASRRMRIAADRTALYQEAVKAIYGLTHFDRVVMYVFDAAWHGKVVAEVVRPGCAHYLGLHFPNTDIPAQARAMYAQTPYRCVVDVDYTPVPLVCTSADAAPLDLSHCSLRSISPIHREYMRNFEARASMSVSVMLGDQLFGLISCTHEQGPKRLCAKLRWSSVAVAETLSGMLSSEMNAPIEEPARVLAPSLVRKMSRLVNISDVLLGDPPNMLGITNADGAAMYYVGRLSTCGEVPSNDSILRLVAWLEKQDLRSGAFVTDSLSKAFPEAKAYRAVACGLLAVMFPGQPTTMMLWFRGEIRRHLDWGGGSPEQVKPEHQPPPLRPRHSFARWQEAVYLHAEPFTDRQVAHAKQLAREVEQSILRQSLHLARANAALERSNQELDAFAHAASHDLKEPLRGVHNFVALAQRELAEGQDASTIAPRLATINKLIERMNTLIAALMHYAQVGRSHLDLRPTPLRPLIDALLETLGKQPDKRRIAFKVDDALPEVLADRTLLSEMFTNLFTNAIKYNERANVRIIVGTEPCEVPGMVTLFVRDNGIGVPSDQHEDIFAIFRRLHAREAFGGGNGTGLTIAKRIVEAHGGSMWLKSEPGHGSTFFFSIRRAPALAL